MYLKSFTFDSVTLDSMNGMVVSIASGNNEVVSMGAEITLNTYLNRDTWQNGIISSSYETPISLEFDIMKKNCINKNELGFTQAEITAMMRWLSSKTYKNFSPVFDDSTWSDIYFKGTFTKINAIVIRGQVVGFNLSFTADSAFGYINKVLEGTTSLTLSTDSDEVGYIYPKSLTITVKTAGTLTITNSLETEKTTIKNCVIGEIITFDCKNKIISTDNEAHKETLGNDFNYNFPRIVVLDARTSDKLSCSRASNMAIEYDLLRKVGMMV